MLQVCPILPIWHAASSSPGKLEIMVTKDQNISAGGIIFVILLSPPVESPDTF